MQLNSLLITVVVICNSATKYMYVFPLPSEGACEKYVLYSVKICRFRFKVPVVAARNIKSGHRWLFLREIEENGTIIDPATDYLLMIRLLVFDL